MLETVAGQLPCSLSWEHTASITRHKACMVTKISETVVGSAASLWIQVLFAITFPFSLASVFIMLTTHCVALGVHPPLRLCT